MHKMKEMMERLEGYAAQELNRSMEQIDTKELGEVIDMLKDLTEGMYYYSVTEAMKKHEEEERMNRKYYRDQPRDSQGRFTDTRNYPYMPEQYLPIEPYYNRMYYNGGGGGSSNSGGQSGSQGGNSSGGSRGYSEWGQNQGRDSREGRSGQSRRYYMDMKNNNSDPQRKMQQLENYMHELSSDIAEMIGDASPEEKTALKQKLTLLQQKL